MEHPIGRHHRPCRSLAGRVWALTAAMLAIALAYVFVPKHPRRERAAIAPAPRRRELPPAAPRRHPVPAPPDFPSEQVWRTSTTRTSSRWENGYGTRTPRTDAGDEALAHCTDSDEAADALVGPYLPSLGPNPRGPVVPAPRVPVGDLLAEPVQNQTDDFADLAAVIRVYLDRVG